MIKDEVECDPFGLRPLWDALIALYQRFSDFCESNGLRHYAAFGTALGAVRHRGFIPWDDDMDVYMPRPDYERLFSLCKDYSADLGFSLENLFTNKEYRLLFGKAYLTDENALCEARMRMCKDVPNTRFFLDIFPLDGLPSSNLRFKLWILERALYRRTQFGFLGREHLRQRRLRHEQWGKKWPYDKSHYVQCYQENLCKIKDRLYTREMFGTAQWIPFDRIKIAVPEDVHGYLRAEFGNDYMKLPPPEKRVLCHV